jgi:soluble lytic murein transglycosylase-like protein
MPTKLLFASRRAGLLGWHPRPRVAPVGRLPLLAALAALLVSASTMRLEALATPSPIPPGIAAPGPEAGDATPPRASAASVPPPNVDALVAALARKYRISQDATRELVDAAYREGGRNRVDPLLIIAVIGVESRFNPIAQSDGGAMGLMQVIPRYHEDKFDAASGESVLDPRTNIQIGAAVLREYIRRGGTETAGLQLYNGAVDDDSNAYAHKVLFEKQRLQAVIRRGS